MQSNATTSHNHDRASEKKLKQKASQEKYRKRRISHPDYPGKTITIGTLNTAKSKNRLVPDPEIPNSTIKLGALQMRKYRENKKIAKQNSLLAPATNVQPLQTQVQNNSIANSLPDDLFDNLLSEDVINNFLRENNISNASANHTNIATSQVISQPPSSQPIITTSQGTIPALHVAQTSAFKQLSLFSNSQANIPNPPASSVSSTNTNAVVESSGFKQLALFPNTISEFNKNNVNFSQHKGTQYRSHRK